MQFQTHLKLKPVKDISKPNHYIEALLLECKDWAYTEAIAPTLKGQWREKAFNINGPIKMDLEIGTGNGLFFAHRAQSCPDRMLIGIERKFKPLIQSIRRALRNESTNARMVRYDAHCPWDLFAENEINDIFIHFPDPWEKKKWNKNRLIQKEFLERLNKLQMEESLIEFKTDHKEYFEWALKIFKESPYQVQAVSFDLHNSDWASTNFVTQFESLFLRNEQPIYFARFYKS